MISLSEFRAIMQSIAYRSVKTNIDPKSDSFHFAVVEWYEDFKDFILADLREAAKAHSSVYFPDISKLAENVRTIERDRLVCQQKKEMSFQSISTQTIKHIGPPILKQIAIDALNVLKSGVTASLWRAMAVKYRDVSNPDYNPLRNPYRTFGLFYDHLADNLERN